jgi:hypothetical protein
MVNTVSGELAAISELLDGLVADVAAIKVELNALRGKLMPGVPPLE